MIESKRFKEIGFNVAQIGFYLMSIEPSLFNDTELHRNIVSLLSQISLYLNNTINTPIEYQEDKSTAVPTGKHYISKSEAIELYHPLITQYSITQAISKNEVKYIKRGNKYFFESDDLKNWIEAKKSSSTNNYLNTGMKFV